MPIVATRQEALLPHQRYHRIVYAEAIDIATRIRELLHDGPIACGGNTFLAQYCTPSGAVIPACLPDNALDSYGIQGEGLEIIVPQVYLPIESTPRYECRRFRLTIKDHTSHQGAITRLYQVVRQTYFPKIMTMTPLTPDEDLQVQRAQWIIDFKEVSDYYGTIPRPNIFAP
jgi:hypothetical protein